MSLREWLETAGDFAAFAARAVPVTALGMKHPRRIVRALYHVLVGVLPLGLATGAAMGVVIWLHLHRMLARFGSGNTALLPQALGLAVVLEFAPVAAGLLVVSRSGAGIAAEIGSMRLTEQIDALEVLGESPWRHLVAPRVSACMLALPLLTVLIAYSAIMGGYFAEACGGTMSWTQFRAAVLKSLDLRDVIPATLKTVAFGYLVGVTGCFCGMAADGGTEGVGRAATRSVVIAVFLVVLADVLLVRLIQLFG